jgi:hypothetical protein
MAGEGHHPFPMIQQVKYYLNKCVSAGFGFIQLHLLESK